MAAVAALGANFADAVLTAAGDPARLACDRSSQIRCAKLKTTNESDSGRYTRQSSEMENMNKRK